MKKAITGLSILTLGYCAGLMSYSFWFTNNHSTELNSSQAKRKPLDNSTQLPVSTDNRLLSNRPESSNQSMSAVQRSEKLLNLEHALSLADFGSRVASGKAYMLLSSASVAELTSLIDDIILSEELDESSAINMLMAVLAEKSPQIAASYLEQYFADTSDGAGMVFTVMEGWASHDPEGAFTWYQLNKEDFRSRSSRMDGFSLTEIFRGLAVKDASLAIESLQQLANSDNELQYAVQGIGRALNSSADYELLLNTSNELFMSPGRNPVIASWARSFPQQASAWTESLTQEENKENIQESVFISWNTVDYTAAADWYLSLASEEERQDRVNFLSKQVFMNDPQEIFSWLNQQENINASESISIFFKSVSVTSPDFVLDNIEYLELERDKVEALFYAYLSYKRDDPLKARELRASSSYKDALEARIREYEEQNRE